MALWTIGLRLGGYVAILAWIFPPALAAAFLAVQLAVFGVYMGASFAPNHKGMPVISAESRLDFLTKQVLTARNVTGGRFVTFLLGGLNYQIEHHLFPSLPRPHVAAAQVFVRAHCAEHRLPYTEASLLGSYAIVVATSTASVWPPATRSTAPRAARWARVGSPPSRRNASSPAAP